MPFGVPDFQNDYGLLDLLANYSVTEQLTLQFQALNLTEERLEFKLVRNIANERPFYNRSCVVRAQGTCCTVPADFSPLVLALLRAAAE